MEYRRTRARGGAQKRVTLQAAAGFFGQARALSGGNGACGSAHTGRARSKSLGHTVKLMSPQFVIPYRKGNKNDPNDAEAICEAVSRPSMRFRAD